MTNRGWTGWRVEKRRGSPTKGKLANGVSGCASGFEAADWWKQNAQLALKLTNGPEAHSHAVCAINVAVGGNIGGICVVPRHQSKEAKPAASNSACVRCVANGVK